MNEPTTRAFTVGASNSLFVHKKSLYDILIELENGKIEILDVELKKQLSLSIEDLRFAENIVRQVEAVSTTKTDESTEFSMQIGQPDVFLEGIGWMGGEEWLRHQFKVYLLAMLRSSTERESYMFNPSFVTAWKQTHNYRIWSAGSPYDSLECLPPGHPNAGTLSMSDMRIRLSQTIQGLDRNKRLNQTLASTGTAVVKTKEAVGGALTSAKGAISNFWSSFTTTDKLVEEGVEPAQEVTDETVPDETAVEKMVTKEKTEQPT